MHIDGTTVQPDVLVTVTSLNADFKNLVLTVSAILDNSTDKYSSLEKCKNYCCSLRTSDNSDQPLFSFESISLIHECTDFSELLLFLNWHLSWGEYSILTYIVDKCQSVKAREEIENFDKKLAEISERLEITSSTPKYNLPPEFKKICVIINKPFKTLSKHIDMKRSKNLYLDNLIQGFMWLLPISEYFIIHSRSILSGMFVVKQSLI